MGHWYGHKMGLHFVQPPPEPLPNNERGRRPPSIEDANWLIIVSGTGNERIVSVQIKYLHVPVAYFELSFPALL